MQTLNKRLADIETKLESVKEVKEIDIPTIVEFNVNDSLSVSEEMLKIKEKQKIEKEENYKNKQKKELNEKEQLYNKGLIDVVGDKEKRTMADIPKIVEYTVAFVEKYAYQFAFILNEIVTGEFKLTTAISLIKNVVHDIDIDFMIALVEEFVYLMFNKNKKEITAITNVRPERKKARKIWRVLLPCIFK
jgi:hypothetical protein